MAKRSKKRVKKSVKNMTVSDMDAKKKKEDLSGLWIPAGIFLGFGFGFIFNNIPAGLFLGLGGGFALMILTRILKKK